MELVDIKKHFIKLGFNPIISNDTLNINSNTKISKYTGVTCTWLKKDKSIHTFAFSNLIKHTFKNTGDVTLYKTKNSFGSKATGSYSYNDDLIYHYTQEISYNDELKDDNTTIPFEVCELIRLLSPKYFHISRFTINGNVLKILCNDYLIESVVTYSKVNTYHSHKLNERRILNNCRINYETLLKAIPEGKALITLGRTYVTIKPDVGKLIKVRALDYNLHRPKAPLGKSSVYIDCNILREALSVYDNTSVIELETEYKRNTLQIHSCYGKAIFL